MIHSPTLNSKPHYPILDGLRGVASMMVVAFHLFEAHSTGHLDQVINHGYLAVDFFFVLSGFVVAYAYDYRWNKMSVGGFFKRRLIRLQPMVIMGMFVGALCFYFQDGSLWSNIHAVPIWKTILVMLVGFTMIPLVPSLDIRGWNESYPLNGPGWSLFYEYIANILYCLFVRKFSKTALSVLVFISGCVLIHFATTNANGDVIGGWSLETSQLRTGFSRVMYPFFAGLLLSRLGGLIHVKNAFALCSLLVVVALATPRIGGSEDLWKNGLYDSLTIIFIFPLIVFLGASGEIKGKFASKACKFLGDISYPMYISHYPLIYIYTEWVADNKVSIHDGYPIAMLFYLAIIALAYICMKFYDKPVRKWLSAKVLLKIN